MSTPDARPASDQLEPQRGTGEEIAETATGGSVGAVDGAAAAGSIGAVSRRDEGFIPTGGPDPSVGPD